MKLVAQDQASWHPSGRGYSVVGAYSAAVTVRVVEKRREKKTVPRGSILLYASHGSGASNAPGPDYIADDDTGGHATIDLCEQAVGR